MNLAEGLAIVAGSRPGGIVMSRRSGGFAAVATGLWPVAALSEDVL